MIEKIKKCKEELINEISSSVIRGIVYAEPLICGFTGIDVSELGFDSSCSEVRFEVLDCLGETIMVRYYNEDEDKYKEVEVKFENCSVDFLIALYELMEK